MCILLLEVRVRFELTVFRICNPVHWTTLPPHPIGLAYRNRTHIRRVEAYCIIRYTKASEFGTSPGTRTPTNGFGDRGAAITLETYKFGGLMG